MTEPIPGIGAGLTVHPDLIRKYRAEGWWSEHSGAELLSRWAHERSDEVAIVDDRGRHTWAEYHARAVQLGEILAELNIGPHECAALQVDDSVEFHIAVTAAERARVVVLGVGARAEYAELAHVMQRSGARTLITTARHRGVPAPAVAHRLRRDGIDLHHVVVLDDLPRVATYRASGDRGFGPDEFSLLNSTSGTTGVPKLVAHTANQWFAFANLAHQAIGLGADDVIGGFVPGPFGFGLWTTHYAPLLLGLRTVITARFRPAECLDLIARERVSMLACVSTQFKMLLNDPALAHADVSSLRVMYTGGEAVPQAPARRFEERTGAVVLQFYGSNEAGAVSATTPDMSTAQRSGTAGRTLPMMDVRRYDDGGAVVTDPEVPGQPGVRGPTSSLGYYRDSAANEQLHSADGRLLLADLITVDHNGFVQVVGRKSDIIIRGGKNISARQVEAAVEEHPDVVMAAAVPVPDPVFGERVCVVVETTTDLDLDRLKAFLADTTLPRESWPEYVVGQPELPRSSGGKVAKGRAREIALSALGMEDTKGTT